MSVKYESIRAEHRTLLLIPNCHCSFCLLLKKKWKLVRELSLSPSISLSLMNLLIGVYTYHYERQEELEETMRDLTQFYKRGMMDRKSRVSSLQREFMGEENDFINQAFSLPDIMTLKNRDLVEWRKRKNRKPVPITSDRKREFERNLLLLRQESVKRERTMNQYIMKTTRPYHIFFVSFHSIKSLEQLASSIHDVHSFINSSVFPINQRLPTPVREIQTQINLLYYYNNNNNRKNTGERLLERGAIWSYIERLFTEYFCERCSVFGHNEEHCRFRRRVKYLKKRL